MQKHRKSQVRLVRFAKKRVKNDQMSGTGYRDKLGNPLNNSSEQSLRPAHLHNNHLAAIIAFILTVVNKMIVAFKATTDHPKLRYTLSIIK